MDRESIKTVVRDVFGMNTPMQDIGGWISMRCPLAPWTHATGHDGSPSAGISVQANDTSIFNCFTCKNTGPVHTMLSKYAGFSGENLDDLIEELEEEEYLGPRTMPTWDQLKTFSDEEVLMPLNEGIYMDLYESAVGHPYLAQRGIDDDTARKLELKFDNRDPSDGEARILFPVRGVDGLLYGFSGRAISSKARLKVRDYEGLKKALNVLGAHLAMDSNVESIQAVEGLFDYANMHQQGFCGCAVMHSTLTDPQAEIFRTIGKPVYLFYDNDKAGREGLLIASRKLQRYIPTMKVRYPQIEIDDDSLRGFHMLKDPGELIADEIQDMITDCRMA